MNLFHNTYVPENTVNIYCYSGAIISSKGRTIILGNTWPTPGFTLVFWVEDDMFSQASYPKAGMNTWHKLGQSESVYGFFFFFDHR